MITKFFLFKWHILVVIGFLAIPVFVSAQSKVVLNPKIITYLKYDTNFWKAEQIEASVLSYVAKPGVEIGYETAKTLLKLDATVDFYKYDDLETLPTGVRKASDDDYVGFTGQFTAKTLVTGRLGLGFDDEILSTRDSAQSDPLNNSVDRRKFLTNRLSPKLYYDFGNKFNIETKYRNTDINYKNDGEDSTENRGIFDLDYNIDRLSKVNLNYQVWNMDYDLSSSDYFSNKVTLNYKKQFNYFTLSGGGGYHKRTFAEDHLDDLDLLSWKLKISGQNPQFPEVQPRSRIDLSLSRDLNTLGTGDEYFTATTVGLEVGYLFLHKLDTSLNIKLQNSDYQDSADNREDDTWTTSGKIKIPVLYGLTLALETGYEKRESNSIGESYDDVFVYCYLDYKYKFGSR